MQVHGTIPFSTMKNDPQPMPEDAFEDGVWGELANTFEDLHVSRAERPRYLRRLADHLDPPPVGPRPRTRAWVRLFAGVAVFLAALWSAFPVMEAVPRTYAVPTGVSASFLGIFGVALAVWAAVALSQHEES